MCSVRRNVKKSPDLGKSIPWPTTVRSIAWLSEMLRKAFLRWRAFTILSQVSEHFCSLNPGFKHQQMLWIGDPTKQ